MKVVKWISYEEADGLPESGVGGISGWFGWGGNLLEGEERNLRPGMRWKDYLLAFKPEAHPYLEALRASIVELRIRHGGDWHQNSEEGAPLFEDGTTATYSYRGWGDLLAAVWAEAEDVDYQYMDFYMGQNL